MHKGKGKVCPDGKPLGDQGVIQREPAQEVNLFIHNFLSRVRMGVHAPAGYEEPTARVWGQLAYLGCFLSHCFSPLSHHCYRTGKPIESCYSGGGTDIKEAFSPIGPAALELSH